MLGLLALALIWGSSFLFVKLAAPGFEPYAIGNGRLLFGLAALLAAWPLLGLRMPRTKRFWGDATILGITFCAFPLTMQAWALQRIDSTLAAVLNAMTPVATVIVGALIFRTRLSHQHVVGIALGLIGVAVAVGVAGDDLSSSSVPGSAVMAGSTLFYGFAFNWSSRRIAPETPAAVLSIAQNATAAVMTLPLAVVASVNGKFSPTAHGVRIPVLSFAPSSIAALAVLGTLGTGLAYLLNQRNIRALGAASASTVTFLIPVVSISLGVIVLDEPLRARHIVGALIIVGGVLLMQGRLRLPRRRQVRAGISQA